MTTENPQDPMHSDKNATKKARDKSIHESVQPKPKSEWRSIANSRGAAALILALSIFGHSIIHPEPPREAVIRVVPTKEESLISDYKYVHSEKEALTNHIVDVVSDCIAISEEMAPSQEPSSDIPLLQLRGSLKTESATIQDKYRNIKAKWLKEREAIRLSLKNTYKEQKLVVEAWNRAQKSLTIYLESAWQAYEQSTKQANPQGSVDVRANMKVDLEYALDNFFAALSIAEKGPKEVDAPHKEPEDTSVPRMPHPVLNANVNKMPNNKNSR